MAEEERPNGDEVAVRMVILFVPIILTARLLGLWVPKPIAWAASMFGWMFAIYWLPSRSDMKLRRWLIIVTVSATAVLILATLQPNSF
jgi:hypothetical protein